ncbi:MAG: histidine triad nucleotide-binding protein [Clostridia bacterium]
MEGCIFCSIAEGKIPAKKVYEDEQVLAFYDVAPQAPVHVLVIPKQHVANPVEGKRLPDAVLAKLLRVAAEVAETLDLKDRGFRIVINSGVDACQSVQHLHVHVLGGRAMGAEMA